MTLKNHLAGTTALFAVASLSTAHAADRIDISISGHFYGGYVAGSVDSGTKQPVNPVTGAAATPTTTATISIPNVDDAVIDRSFTDQPGRNQHNSYMWQESEIRFRGETKLDNGFEVGVVIQLEGETCLDQLDETYMYVEHEKLGRVELGQRDVAAFRMVPQASSVTLMRTGFSLANQSPFMASFGELFNPVTNPGKTALADSTLGFNTLTGGAGYGDATKISYITPRVFGVQVGLSYSHDACESTIVERLGNLCRGSALSFQQNNNFPLADAGVSDAYSIGFNSGIPIPDGIILFGASYSRSLFENQSYLGTVLSSEDINEWHAGLNVSWRGIGVGGVYRELDTGDGAPQYTVFSLGTSYETGPYGISLEYFNAKAERPTKAELFEISQRSGSFVSAVPGVAATPTAIQNAINEYSDAYFGGEDTLDAFAISATYELGPGVVLWGTAQHYDFDSDRNTGGAVFEATVGQIGTAIQF